MTARLRGGAGARSGRRDRMLGHEEVRLLPNAALWEWRGAGGLAELVGWMLDARPRPRIDVTLDLGRRTDREDAATVSVPELALRVLHGPADLDDSALAVVAPYLGAALRWAEAAPPAARAHTVTAVRAYGPSGDIVADVLATTRPAALLPGRGPLRGTQRRADPPSAA